MELETTKPASHAGRGSLLKVVTNKGEKLILESQQCDILSVYNIHKNSLENKIFFL
jgi:hypothetical protein